MAFQYFSVIVCNMINFNEIVGLLSAEVQLKHLMMGHGLFSMILGFILVVLPHSFSKTTFDNHIAHEFMRFVIIFLVTIMIYYS